MPHLSLDLDALERVPEVASAAGVPRGEVLFGLCAMWRWCWRERTDVITTEQLHGFFTPATEQLPGALIAFGFLATVPAGYRIRGADRYLRVKQAQKLAAERTNARRSTARSSDGTPNGLPSNGIPTATPYGTAHGLPHGTPNGQATVSTPLPPTPPFPPSEQRAAGEPARTPEDSSPEDPTQDDPSVFNAPVSRVHVAVQEPDGTRRDLPVELHWPPPDGQPTAYHVEVAWRREWLAAKHPAATGVSHAAAKAARWASENGVTWGDLLPVLRVMAQKARGLALLATVYDEIHATLDGSRGTDDEVPDADGIRPSRRISSAVIAALDVPPNGPEDDLDH